MAYNNGFHFVGGLTKDCELKKTNSGKSICEFTLGVDKYIKNEKGTDYFTFTVWDQTAEYMSKYGKKGTTCAVSGVVRQRIWERDGQKHYEVEFVPDAINGVHLYQRRPQSAAEEYGLTNDVYDLPDD